MRNRLIRTLGVALGLLIVSVPLFAHHANAVFDVGKRITVKGTVTEWFWANPHCLLRLDVKDDRGNVVHWIAETQAPPNMIPFGWSKRSFTPGEEVTLTPKQALWGVLRSTLAQIGASLHGMSEGISKKGAPAGCQL